MKKVGGVTRSSLLYKSKVEYADFCINHVVGCSHGCKFPCYAFMMSKRFGNVKNYEEWCQPKLVTNALDLLDKEIPKYKDEIKFVHLCFMTDPFMYKHPEVAEMTLKIIERLNKDKIKSTVLTKGIYPKDLIDDKKYGKKNEYGITLVSLDNGFRKRFEPGSAVYLSRIKSLRRLHEAGLNTWVSMEPYPTPNLVEQDLKNILEELKFVDKIVFGKLNYNCVSSNFPNNKEFYEDCANVVETFCKKNKIKCHIKFGTKKRDNKESVKIFKKK
ncbi:MAG TPA: radical SAM protein [Candidatus Pacearchaeota archaeon]|nr:radical SAM protein [Candidatus Pacearchaeota archaeon]